MSGTATSLNAAQSLQGEIDLSSTTVPWSPNGTMHGGLRQYSTATAPRRTQPGRVSRSDLRGPDLSAPGHSAVGLGLGHRAHEDIATNARPGDGAGHGEPVRRHGQRLQPTTLRSGPGPGDADHAVTAGPTRGPSPCPRPALTTPVMGPLTISGTATPAPGAVVARVEVSTDGGTTWNPATGLSNVELQLDACWRSGRPRTSSAPEDDSDIGQPGRHGRRVTVGPGRAAPARCSPTSQVPVKPDSGDGNAINVGMKFQTTTAGAITGVQFYKGAGQHRQRARRQPAGPRAARCSARSPSPTRRPRPAGRPEFAAGDPGQ